MYNVRGSREGGSTVKHHYSQRISHSCLLSAVLPVPCHSVRIILSSRMLVMWLAEEHLSFTSVGGGREQGVGQGEEEGMKREYHI